MFAAISISYIVHLESIWKCERVRTRDKQCERKARTTLQTIDDFVIQMLSAGLSTWYIQYTYTLSLHESVIKR